MIIGRGVVPGTQEPGGGTQEPGAWTQVSGAGTQVPGGVKDNRGMTFTGLSLPASHYGS